MELHSIIKRPLITEKSTISRDEGNKYIFEVDRRANKIEIGNAVEKIFKVKVIDVRTMNMAGKKKRMGRIVGQKNDWKKAIVTLAEGNTIEMFEKV
jgi:large subunit ribosomal protein L23